MALETVEDIIRALQEHPEWREPLLNALLTDQYRQLPSRADRLEEALARLAAAQEATQQTLHRFMEQTEQRFRQVEEQQRQQAAHHNDLAEKLIQLTARVDDLARCVQELTGRVDGLTARVDDLTVRLEQLTARVDDLTVRLEQLTARVDDLTVRLEQLTARVDDLTVRLEQLTARVDDLTVRLEQLTARVDDLTVRLEQLTARVDQIAEQMAARFERLERDVGELKGLSLEQYYRNNATALLGLFFRKLRVVDKGRLIDTLYEQRAPTREEWEQISQIDLLVKGIHRSSDEERLLVWEISWTVDEQDVSRAMQRSELLRQWGLNTVPVVAGKGITGNARATALSSGVLVLLDTTPIDGSGLV
ncbi:MAG: hypothetical protein KatS3mg022_0040 [Armatimonadota bacterium]|nr:MAG: hypothetical protein KatS3mg022_0040 [Armatimonadota bacterium]